MSMLDRYRVEAPSPAKPCSRHPEELQVYAEIPIRDLTNDERPAVVRGWTCPRCFTRRGFTVEAA